jgi:flagellar biosynthetic protein FliR
MFGDLLQADVFAFFLVFVRIGAAMMLMPVIGEAFVLARARLALALLTTLVVLPVVAPHLPAMPASALGVGVLVLGEAVVGLFLGTVTRLFISSIATAGMMIAQSTSLANALVQDPTAAQQGSIAGNFLTMTALVMIMMLDIHHLMIRALVDSYAVFVPGHALPLGDFSKMISQIVSETFLLAVKISAPFISLAVILQLGLGLLGRLMPQMQVFFVAMPLQIAMGMFALAIALPILMHVFLGAFQDTVMQFVAS